MSRSNGNNRISALKRLGKSSSISSINRRQLFAGDHSSEKDERDFSAPRGSPYDVRQITNRTASRAYGTTPTNVIVRKNIEEVNNDNDKMIVITGLKNMKMKDGRVIPTVPTDVTRAEINKNVFAAGSSTFVTFRNNNNVNMGSNPSNEKISLTKTITNTTIRREDDDYRTQMKTTFAAQSTQKIVCSVVNDKYQKTPIPSQMTTAIMANSPRHYDPPPMIKRLHDACIQTTPPPSSSRSPIRMNMYRQLSSTNTIDDQDRSMTRTIDDELYEPPIKRTMSTTRKTTTGREQPSLSSTIVAPTGALKRSSAGAPITTKSTSTMSKSISTTQSQSNPGTILVTNLLPSVSEEDVVELFSQIGRIIEIITLSAGCLQIVYAKREFAEQAVVKYHNRLLDGQFIYVSLQQTAASYSAKQLSKSTNNSSQPTKENGSSTTAPPIPTNQPLKFNTSSMSSTKISIDPAFIRQALFHPSNDTHPVQFQVKL
ncbi:hypothetical protein I4U23_017729 [Adineta vaga]|nr:hypothetical protein I4U23_017729 [Adineta vaga]